MNILIFSIPPQTLKNHRETLFISRETFSTRRETLITGRKTLKTVREALFTSRDTFSTSRQTLFTSWETLFNSRETFSEDNFPEETREYLFPAKENKITKLKLNTAAEVICNAAYSGAENFYHSFNH